MPETVRVVDTLEAVGRDRWTALFPRELEGFDYLRAVEASGLEGFRWRYVLAERDGEPVAAAPAFLNDYPLDTTLSGAPKRWLEALRRTTPLPLVLKLACIGSPCTETAQVGFAAHVAAAERPQLVAGLLAGWARYAAEHRYGLLAVKDLAAPDAPLWADALAAQGYRATPGLACAALDIDFPSVDAYLARLSPGTRKDMRRKLKRCGRVQVEHRRDLDGDLLAQVMPIYAATRERAEMAFEDLTPAYFEGVMTRMADRAVCTLYRVDGELMACNLMLHDDTLLLDKFFCMKPEGRDFDIYYLSWFENLRFCLDHGLTRYQSGQAAYANKLKLGSRLTPNAMWFRHRNPVVNGLLRVAAPLFAAPDPLGPTHAPAQAKLAA